MTAIAIYARYSSDQQRNASIEDQVRICRERAGREGWHVAQCYADHGISGASLLRPGIQQLLQDAGAGRFAIVVTEAIDRLSRDQEDIAHIYKRLAFAGVRIVTLSEGDVTELHVGLKGTMAALYLKDLAEKTRRGLRGRVEAGKSGGGNAYGYSVVRRFTAGGEPVRGDRTINPDEAAVVRRIFKDYAEGKSPEAIAKQLNREDVQAPGGRGWAPSTIHGHRQRGTGILNNELYIGRIVWNRQRYIKDPVTGKRVSRRNPPSEWIVKDVPDLRIIDQPLWDAVKARQGALRSTRSGEGAPGYWDRRRPRYLFSGLVTCGACGGAFINLNTERLGCATARYKGTCDNRRTIRRVELEAYALDALRNRLMDDRLCSRFAETYTRRMNELRATQSAQREADRAALEKVERELDRLVQALADGVPASRVKTRMEELDTRKALLESRLADSKEEPLRLHPNMAQHYRSQVSELREALNDETRRARAAELIRSLVERIELHPVERNGRKELRMRLHGALAGILSVAVNAKKPLDESGFPVESVKLVAGAGFKPATFSTIWPTHQASDHRLSLPIVLMRPVRLPYPCARWIQPYTSRASAECASHLGV